MSSVSAAFHACPKALVLGLVLQLIPPPSLKPTGCSGGTEAIPPLKPTGCSGGTEAIPSAGISLSILCLVRLNISSSNCCPTVAGGTCACICIVCAAASCSDFKY